MYLQAYAASVQLSLRMRIEFHVGEVVRKIRKQLRWNQMKLGAKAAELARRPRAINKGTISKLERHGDSGMETDTIEAVAAALGMSKKQLYALVPDAIEIGDPRTRESKETQRSATAKPSSDAAGNFPHATKR